MLWRGCPPTKAHEQASVIATVLSLSLSRGMGRKSVWCLIARETSVYALHRPECYINTIPYNVIDPLMNSMAFHGFFTAFLFFFQAIRGEGRITCTKTKDSKRVWQSNNKSRYCWKNISRSTCHQTEICSNKYSISVNQHKMKKEYVKWMTRLCKGRRLKQFETAYKKWHEF
jgi:hypothetical protein